MLPLIDTYVCMYVCTCIYVHVNAIKYFHFHSFFQGFTYFMDSAADCVNKSTPITIAADGVVRIDGHKYASSSRGDPLKCSLTFLSVNGFSVNFHHTPTQHPGAQLVLYAADDGDEKEAWVRPLYNSEYETVARL